MQIYHNPRCGKSRSALQILQEKGIEPEVILYLKENPTKKEIKEILKKLGMKAEELVRKNEKLFKAEFKGKAHTNSQWIDILYKNPILIERPIVIDGDRAIVARPPEKLLALL